MKIKLDKLFVKLIKLSEKRNASSTEKLYFISMGMGCGTAHKQVHGIFSLPSALESLSQWTGFMCEWY